MSLFRTGHYAAPSKPAYGDPYIGGQKILLSKATTGVADIKGAFFVAEMTGRTNEMDRCDTAALIAKAYGIARAPKRAECKGTIIDPLIDYVYSADEVLRGYILCPGSIFFTRSVDNTSAIVAGNTCVQATTNTLAKMLDALVIETSTTGAEVEASQLHSGELIPLGWKYMAMIDRAQSATESWLPAMALGR
jgi:hypothetical protein